MDKHETLRDCTPELKPFHTGREFIEGDHRKIKDLSVNELCQELVYEIRDLTFSDQMQIVAAIELADFAHTGQKRDNDKPYIIHPLRNALRITRYYKCYDADIITAALLHDTVEDAADKLVKLSSKNAQTDQDKLDVSLDFLAEVFNPVVSEIVGKVTIDPSYKTKDKKDKQEMYLEHTTELVKDYRAFLAKLADWEDNGISLRFKEKGKQKFKLAKKYLPLADIFETALQVHLQDPRFIALGTDNQYIADKIERGHQVLSEIMEASNNNGDSVKANPMI